MCKYLTSPNVTTVFCHLRTLLQTDVIRLISHFALHPHGRDPGGSLQRKSNSDQLIRENSRFDLPFYNYFLYLILCALNSFELKSYVSFPFFPVRMRLLEEVLLHLVNDKSHKMIPSYFKTQTQFHKYEEKVSFDTQLAMLIGINNRTGNL